MRDHWELEFVGGPLDGRQDIPTPVEYDQFTYQTCAPLPVATLAGEVPAHSALFNHRYHRRVWRHRRPDGQRGWIEQYIWLYEGLGQ
ncbi:hypothetical protein LCGC14_1247730 [marine sediment metagenome]|uniref:Uncharacterized protein n=1 Tax=marine sediment metagenome TaxID=412755 RepID=A0A0F9LQY6_9ZZZZ